MTDIWSDAKTSVEEGFTTAREKLSDFIDRESSGRKSDILSPLLAARNSNEVEFQKGIRGTDWFKEYTKEYGEEPDLRPVSDDPRLGPGYDYRKAWAEGIRPQRDPYDKNRFHWPSAAESGQMLKSKSHPTAWKELFMRKHGVNPDSLSDEAVRNMRKQQ